MTTMTFDTLKYSRRLQSGGMPATQAESQAQALAEIFDANPAELATKQDLQLELVPIRAELTLLKWMLGALMADMLSLIIKTFF